MRTFRVAAALMIGALVLGEASAAPSEDKGSIKGKVTLKDGREGLKPDHTRLINAVAAAQCGVANCGNRPTNPFNEVQKAANGSGLRWVLVSIKHDFGDRKFEVPKEPAVLNQKCCEYQPRVLGLMVGQKLEVRNGDPTNHNVHGLPKKNQEFNDSQPAEGAKTTYTFTQPEVFFVKCDVHGWMGAHVGVFEHPFFAVTDEKGEFEIKNVPAGEYSVEFWHPTFGTQTQKVKVADAAVEAKVEFEDK